MAGGRESGHIHADLSDQCLGHIPANPGDGIQLVHHGVQRAQALRDLLAQAVDGLIEEVDVRQLLGD